MKLRMKEHKDFINIFTSLVLITLFFLLIITTSAKEADALPHYSVVPVVTFSQTFETKAIENLDLNNEQVLDYFLANLDLFSDDIDRGFNFSESMNSLWLGERLLSTSA